MKQINKNSIATIITASLVLGLMGPFTALAVTATAPNLGTASTFSVIGVTLTADGSGATISGDLGATTKTGTWTHTGGIDYLAGAAAGALSAATAAWTTMGSGGGTAWNPVTDISPAPGLWTRSGDATFSNTLTLNGSATDVWIFQINSSLTFTGTVNLTGGAQACNVYWRIASDATINSGGALSKFVGTLIANGNVSTVGGVTVDGRLMSNTGTLSTAGVTSITGPTCVVPGVVPGANLGSGGVPPVIDLVKTPSPLTLPFGGGSVTYNYKVKNIGTVPMHFVELNDDHCPSQNIKFLSSDKNSALTSVDSNSWLAVGETWSYSCTTNVAQTTLNTAVVTGQANSIRATDTAVATVGVGLSLPPPLIHVVKTASSYLLPAGGGTVTYTYTVTNPGTAPLSDVSITDNKCTGLPGRVSGHPGDLNKNDLLESNEVWTFTCQSTIRQTTVNTATAKGSANGLTAFDYAYATVAVAAPALPNTGLPPESASWSIVLLSGLFLLVLASIVVTLKKRKI